MRLKLNCWVAAMWLWLATRGKHWASVRRSHWFEGMIPHFGLFRLNGRFCLFTEYIPNRRKGEPKRDGDVVIFFNGVYRVVLFKKVAEVTSSSYEEAVKKVFLKARKRDGQIVDRCDSCGSVTRRDRSGSVSS